MLGNKDYPAPTRPVVVLSFDKGGACGPADGRLYSLAKLQDGWRLVTLLSTAQLRVLRGATLLDCFQSREGHYAAMRRADGFNGAPVTVSEKGARVHMVTNRVAERASEAPVSEREDISRLPPVAKTAHRIGGVGTTRASFPPRDEGHPRTYAMPNISSGAP